MENRRLLRITTVPISLLLLLKGQFRYMREQGFKVLTVSANGEEVARVKEEGVDHVVVPFTRRITPFRDFACLVMLIKLIKTFRPHIVHTHTPKAGLLGMIASFVCRVPVRLHTVAGLPFMEQKGWRRKLLMTAEEITYNCAHKVYPNSEALRSYIDAQFKLKGDKLRVIGKGSSNGIDVNYFSRTPDLINRSNAIKAEFKIHPQEFTFSFVGRIVRDKGIVELANAFKLLGLERRVRLLIIGPFESNLSPLPEETMKFLRHDSRVVLAGFQQDVRAWILASDLFVFPSYREGFPNVVMQAGLLGVPCIVSDINGCNEIIRHNENGLVVPPKEILQLKNAMAQLIDDDGLRKIFAEKTKDFIKEHFSQSYFWNELLKEYQLFLK